MVAARQGHEPRSQGQEFLAFLWCRAECLLCLVEAAVAELEEREVEARAGMAPGNKFAQGPARLRARRSRGSGAFGSALAARSSSNRAWSA